MALFQLDLKQLPVVETRRSVAGGQIGAADGAEPVAVGVALVAEHEAEGASHLGGAGPGGVGGHRHGAPVGGCGPQTGQGGLQTVSDEHIGDVAGILPPLRSQKARVPSSRASTG